MEKKKKEKKGRKFKLPKRKQPVFNFFKKIFFGPIYRAKVESEIKVLPDKAVIASIHSAKSGPMSIAVSYPKFCAIWGHGAMLGSYRDRFKYLRNVLYIQKMHKNKFVATFKALYEAVFSIWVYKGMKMVGTYTDMRMLTTIKNSVEILDDNASIVIFPEDSSKGYFEKIQSAYSGFVVLASQYYKKRGEDVPVLPMYVSPKTKRLIVGKPRYVHELELAGHSKEQIAEIFKNDVNELYDKYIATGEEVKECVDDAPVRDRAYYGEN